MTSKVSKLPKSAVAENFDVNEFEEIDENPTTTHDNDNAEKFLEEEEEIDAEEPKEGANHTNNKNKKTKESNPSTSESTEENNTKVVENGTKKGNSLPHEEQTILDERSVFVKNIDGQVQVDQLKEHFETCGAVERVTILANKQTGQPKGCAYVQFKTKLAVANALLLDGKTWQDKVLEVKPKRTNLPYWMRVPRGRGRGVGRGASRGGGRGTSYQGQRGKYQGNPQWHPYAGQ